jgi:hypothetical protein
MRYERARPNLDRDLNYILAAYMASGTQPSCISPDPTPGDALSCRIAGVACPYPYALVCISLMPAAINSAMSFGRLQISGRRAD